MRLEEQHRRERDAVICEAFRNGATRKGLMKEFDISHATLYRVLTRGGIPPAQTIIKISAEQRQERDAAVCEAARSGMTVPELVGMFGLSRQSIGRSLHGSGIKPLKARRKPLKARRKPRASQNATRDAAICEAARTNASMPASELATMFGISKPSISRILIKNGISQAAIAKAKQREQDKMIGEMHHYGLTAQNISFEFNISLGAAYLALKRMGLAPNAATNLDRRNADICDAFRNGSSRYELAEQFKVADETIFRVLNAEELVARTGSKLTLRNADIRKAYREGATMRELAPQFNLSVPQIWRILGGTNDATGG
jgi:Mor family transcriptional regulator